MATIIHDYRVIFRDSRIDPRPSFKETTRFNISWNKSISLSTVKRMLVKYKIVIYIVAKKQLVKFFDEKR